MNRPDIEELCEPTDTVVMEHKTDWENSDQREDDERPQSTHSTLKGVST